MATVQLAQLLEAGVHFGHKANRWNPKMFPYIYSERDGIHILDLVQTSQLLNEASQFVNTAAQKDKIFLFVGTKRQAAAVIEQESKNCNSYYVNHRWLGGMLTNWKTVRTRIERLKKLEQQEQDGIFDLLPKKEVASTRKELEKSITQEALAMIVPDANSTVVCSERWHKGVVGIVASRLIETHYRPTIVLTESNGKLTGSARSVRGFDVYNAIDACSDLLEQFGGHKYAAGLTLKKENLTAFTQRFEEVVSTTITAEMQIPKINIDLEMPMEDISMKTHRIIEQMSPFGPSNSRPVFMTKAVIDNGSGRLIGQDKNHLKLAITDADNSKTLDGIGFAMSDYFSTIKDRRPFDVCFVLDINEWNGNSNLQLRIKDIRNNTLP